jgi:hypothetical protein
VAHAVSPDYTVTEVVDNFSAMLDQMDFESELGLLNISPMHFLLRKKMKDEWQALVIGLWKLALNSSFPDDGDVIFETLLADKTQHFNPGKKEAFISRVLRYAASIQAQGIANFMPTSGHLLAVRRVAPAKKPAMQLRIALHMRNLYASIFAGLLL